MADTTKTRFNGVKLKPDDVYMILTRHDLTMYQLADMIGVASSTVQKVRRGQSMTHLFPEIPRSHQRIVGPRCTDCVHDHHGACSLDFPERRTQGSIAASVCSAYMSALARA